MARFQLFGKIATIMNPLPKSTRREVIERAGFRTRPSDGDPDAQDFAIEMVYGSHEEIGIIQPGDQIEIQDAGAEIMVNLYQECGLVAIGPNDDEREASIRGLEKAIAFYNYRGDQQLAILGMQFSDDEMRRLKREFRGLYVNQAREQILQEELNRLLNYQEPKKTETVSEEPDRLSTGERYIKHTGFGNWSVYEEGNPEPLLRSVTKDEAEVYLSGSPT